MQQQQQQSTSDRHIVADFRKTRPAYWHGIEEDVIIIKLAFYKANLRRRTPIWRSDLEEFGIDTFGLTSRIAVDVLQLSPLDSSSSTNVKRETKMK